MHLGDETVYTVAQINGLVRELVETAFPAVAVTGEISNFKRHTSGHLYFSLKDADAALRAVCFRGTARDLVIEPRDGMQVIVRGRLTVYEGQGSYQIVAASIEEAGQGDLGRAFRALVARLDAEGLFDPARKRPLPLYPERIAVITSPTGAAIRDILSTIGRRWPCVEVIVVPVRVQGESAAPEIAGALDSLSRAAGIDLVIVGRGGGSLEDLWAFNDEEVARAIHRSTIPVISAVGHETDVTIADFVADRRAATPTMAAEIAVPLRSSVVERVDQAAARLSRAVNATVDERRRRLDELLRSYALGQVRGRVERSLQLLDYATERLARSAAGRVREHRAALERLAATLSVLDPKRMLSRGYAICAEPSTGKVIRSGAAALESGAMHVTFHDGTVVVDVKEKR
jgi:exodeoxyribonuclease VII large subunit